MLGLMVFGSAALYLGLMLWVMIWAWGKGRANGGSALRATAFAAVGFLSLYLPVFWNHIPTLVLRHHYCAKDAGFVAHVPAEQWLAEHAEQVSATRALPREQREKTLSSTALPDGFTRDIYFSGLLASDSNVETISAWGGSVRRRSSRIVDARSGELLATATDYTTGKEEDLRMWLNTNSCVTRPTREVGQPVTPSQPFDFLTFYTSMLRGEQP
jgi:hypothetical protein